MGEWAEVIPINDIRTVANAADIDCEVVIKNVTILGNLHLDMVRACLNCKGRVEPPDTSTGEVCQTRLSTQWYDLFTENTRAKLMLMYESDG